MGYGASARGTFAIVVVSAFVWIAASFFKLGGDAFDAGAEVGPGIHYLSDTAGRLTDRDILYSGHLLFKRLSGDFCVGGTAPAAWFSLNTSLLAEAASRSLLVFGDPLLHGIRLYRVVPGGIPEPVRPVDAAPGSGIRFRLEGDAAAVERYLVELRSPFRVCTVPRLVSDGEFERFSAARLILMGGAIVSLSLPIALGWGRRLVAKRRVVLANLYLLVFLAVLFHVSGYLPDPLSGAALARIPVFYLYSPLIFFSAFLLADGVRPAALVPNWRRVPLLWLIPAALHAAGAADAAKWTLSAIVFLLALGCVVAIMLAVRRREWHLAILVLCCVVVSAALLRLCLMDSIAPSAFGVVALAAGAYAMSYIVCIREAANTSHRMEVLGSSKAGCQMRQILETHIEELRQETGRREELEEGLRGMFERVRQALEVEKVAREQQRMFVSMVSHEFRTPLTIIDTIVQRMSAGQTMSLQNSKRLGNIADSVSRMVAMLDEFLTLDRLEDKPVLRRKSDDLVVAVHKVLAEWPPSMFEASIPHVQLMANCDAALMGVAIRNLVANAVRHCPGGARVRVQLCATDGFIRLDVSNMGCTLNPEEIPLVFQKYFRGHNSIRHPGAGLGLYLVSQIALLHGGEAVVHCEGGTVTFGLTIPLE